VFPLFVVLFLLLPLAELWVIVQVADGIGIGLTILTLLTVSLVGAWLLKQQGWSALRRAQSTLSAGSLPTTELVDGALIVLGGALLLTPGFITDGVGFVLLVPPTRAVVRSILASRFEAKVHVVMPPGSKGPGSDPDIGGAVVDVDGREQGTRPRPSGPPRLEP
jgi:UPF0716 protein FxsA